MAFVQNAHSATISMKLENAFKSQSSVLDLIQLEELVWNAILDINLVRIKDVLNQ